MNEQDRLNLEIARLLYSGDEAERVNIAQDIVWHVPGHNQVSGNYHGYAEYTELMPSRMAPLSRWDFTLEKLMVNGNYVMTTFHLHGERNGKSVNLQGGHLLRLRDGKVVEGWGFTDNQDALDDFFST
jgi:ketosteroid isomerase-like protein